MPLLSPAQLATVLREAPAPKKDAKTTIGRLLEDANLSPEEILENLSSLMRSGESDSVRLRAAETGLKLNGLLDSDTKSQTFSVTINISDSEFDINPILIPRA